MIEIYEGIGPSYCTLEVSRLHRKRSEACTRDGALVGQDE